MLQAVAYPLESNLRASIAPSIVLPSSSLNERLCKYRSSSNILRLFNLPAPCQRILRPKLVGAKYSAIPSDNHIGHNDNRC